jgi:hypothetical protein
MPAELLRLAGGALRDHDVDEGGAGEVHRLVEGAAQVLRILDKEALAAEGANMRYLLTGLTSANAIIEGAIR